MSHLKLVSFKQYMDEAYVKTKKKQVTSWEELNQALSVMMSPSIVVFDPLNTIFISHSYLLENNNPKDITPVTINKYKHELETTLGLKPGAINKYDISLTTVIYILGIYAQSLALEMARNYNEPNPIENYVELTKQGAISLIPRFYLKRE